MQEIKINSRAYFGSRAVWIRSSVPLSESTTFRPVSGEEDRYTCEYSDLDFFSPITAARYGSFLNKAGQIGKTIVENISELEGIASVSLYRDEVKINLTPNPDYPRENKRRCGREESENIEKIALLMVKIVQKAVAPHLSENSWYPAYTLGDWVYGSKEIVYRS